MIEITHCIHYIRGNEIMLAQLTELTMLYAYHPYHPHNCGVEYIKSIRCHLDCFYAIFILYFL